MEKSYELAARYNGKQTPSVIPTDDRKDRTSVKPVKRIRQEVVSSLAQPVNDGDFIAGVSEERNTGFHTPVGRTPVSDRNTIAACVHGTQTVSDGQALRVRLLEAMAGGRPPHTQRNGIDRQNTDPGRTHGYCRHQCGISRDRHSGGTGSV